MEGREHMCERNVSQVRRVTEIQDNTEYVNERLAEGWILLHIYSGSSPSDNGPCQYPVYVLGWTSEGLSPSEVEGETRAAEGIARMQELRQMNQE